MTINAGCAKNLDLREVVELSTSLKFPLHASYEIVHEEQMNLVVRIVFPDSYSNDQIKKDLKLRALSREYGKLGYDEEFDEIMKYFDSKIETLWVSSGIVPTRWETIWSDTRRTQIVNIYFNN